MALNTEYSGGSGWRYIVQALPSGEFIYWNLPLQNVVVTRNLSSPGRLSGTVPVEFGELIGQDGKPVLQPWKVAIWAEADGQIRGGGILTDLDYTDTELTVDVMGLSGYPNSQTYLGSSKRYIQTDPLDIVRDLWAHLQSFDDGDLGITIDSTRSGVLVGTEEVEGDSDSGPYEVNWYTTTDMGRVITEFAETVPFDYREITTWSGDNLEHKIEIAVPTFGTRKEHLRLVLGENCSQIPSVQVSGADYASTVLLQGIGEGEAMIRTVISQETGGLRRAVAVADKSVASLSAANNRARAELALRIPSDEFSELQVIEHANMPLGSVDVGDVIPFIGSSGWLNLDRDVLVTSISFSPENQEVMVLSVTEV